MKPEITQRIEHYLQNELSAQDRAAFVSEMNSNADLLREVNLQQSIHEAAKRLAQRQLVQRTAKRYHLRKTLVATAVVVVIVTAVAVWLVGRSSEKQRAEPADAVAMAQLIGKLDDKLPLDGAPAEYFDLGREDTVVLSGTGVLLSVPETAFQLDGVVYKGRKVIQWQEAFDAATIVKCGLSTMAGDRLLETGGMFGMQAFTPTGEMLDINPKVGVYIQIPVAECKKGMMLFEGKKGSNGVVDWQNPQPLEKLPVMADMSELDFYPPGYEKLLDKLHWKTAKEDRDSLYLSFGEDEYKEVEPRNELKPAYPSVSNPRVISQNVAESGSLMIDGAMSSEQTENVLWDCSVEKTDATHGFIVVKATLKPGERIFAAGIPTGSFGVPTQMTLAPDENFTPEGKLRNDGVPRMFGFEGDSSLIVDGTVIFRQAFSAHTDKPFAIAFDVTYQVCNDRGCLPPATVKFSVNASGFNPGRSGHIPPSRVLAFWQKEFNNTLLATRDFERRMPAIHRTCSEEVLELYTDNLNKPLHEIDALVARLGHDEFSAFADERVGAVKLDNPHMNNMRRFYAHAVSVLKKAANEDRAVVRKAEAAWNAELRVVRRKAEKENTKRNRTASAEELKFNRESVMRQFSSNTMSMTIRRDSPSRIYNCDTYASAVVVREERNADGSTDYTRTTGRMLTETRGEITIERARISYGTLSLNVATPEKYGKLMLYLFPHELNSFLRVDPVNGNFSREVNDGLTYDVAVIGIAENGYFLWEKRGLNGGSLGEVSLAGVSEEMFNYRIRTLNRDRGRQPRSVELDLDWLIRERGNYAVQRLRQAEDVFRGEVRTKVFPCTGDEFTPPASGTTETEEIAI